MDVPLVVTPDSLTQLRDELASAARTIGRMAGRAEQVAASGGWSGGAEHAFAAAARTAGAQCDVAARRLTADAVRVDGLADELVHELWEIERVEQEMLDAVRRLSRESLEDVGGAATATYERVRHLLPVHLSPHWRTLASTLSQLL